MRGFPLVSSLLLLVLFGAAWPVLQVTVGGKVQPVAVDSAELDRGEERGAAGERRLVALRVVASEVMSRLRIDYLGESLAEEESDAVEFDMPLADFSFPDEGIDLWIEVEFADDPGAGGNGVRRALRVEVEDSDGAVYQQTLWSEHGDGVADSVYFGASGEGGME